MLVLSRKVGERIVIPGCEIVFTILEVKGSQIRVGISAPREVAVYREELWCSLHPAEAGLGNQAPQPTTDGVAE